MSFTRVNHNSSGRIISTPCVKSGNSLHDQEFTNKFYAVYKPGTWGIGKGRVGRLIEKKTSFNQEVSLMLVKEERELILEGKIKENKFSATYKALIAIGIVNKNGFIEDQNVHSNLFSKQGKTYTPEATKAFLKALETGNLHAIISAIANDRANVNAKNNNGNTALILAVKKKDIKLVEFLIQQGADVNIAGMYGLTPLSYAEAYGLTKIVELLVQQGADVNHQNEKDASTALIHAMNNEHTEAVEVLIAQGASYNEHFITDAFKKGQIEIVKILIKMGKNIKQWDYILRAVLHSNDGMCFAFVDFGKITPKLLVKKEIFELLVRQGKSAYDYRILEIAINYNWKEIIEIIIANNDDNNFVNSALIIASETHSTINNIYYNEIIKNRPEIVELLIKKYKANVNYVYNGETALIKAVHSGNKEIVELLIQNKADVNYKHPDTRINGYTQYYYSAFRTSISNTHLWVNNPNDPVVKNQKEITQLLLENMTIEQIKWEAARSSSRIVEPVKSIIEKVINNKLKTLCLLGTHFRVGEKSALRTWVRSEIYDPNNMRQIFEYAGLSKPLSSSN